jgi:hypothetical protein
VTLDQIETAIGQRLATLAGVPPIAWPNKDAPGAVPYVEFRHFPNTRDKPAMDGSGPTIHAGIVLVTVVSARNAFTRAANITAQAVADRFPQGLRLAAGAGRVVIAPAPEFVPGFTDGTHHRQPVRIRYTTEG